MTSKRVLLCEPPETCCPAVELGDDGTVTIGEDGKVAVLTRAQWNILVGMIREGTL